MQWPLCIGRKNMEDGWMVENMEMVFLFFESIVYKRSLSKRCHKYEFNNRLPSVLNLAIILAMWLSASLREASTV